MLSETEALLAEERVAPTENVLRVLLTLACRCEGVRANAEEDQITRMLQTALTKSKQKVETPTGAFSDRSRSILQRIDRTLAHSYRENPPVFRSMYATCMNTMAEFCTPNLLNNRFEFVSDSEEESLLLVDKKRVIVSPKKRRKARKLSTPAKTHPTDSRAIRVFSEPVITTVITPCDTSPYNFWTLVEWTFFCCYKSSAIAEFLLESSSYHELYQGYSSVLKTIWHLVSTNYVHVMDQLMNEVESPNHIVHMFFYSSESKQNEIASALQDSSLFMLRGLMAQASDDKEEWYRKIALYVFYGTVDESMDAASPYTSDRQFIRKRSDPARGRRTSVTSDMAESMALRVDILSLVYYNSLFFDQGAALMGVSDVEPQDYDLVTRRFIFEVSERLLKLSYQQTRLFFEASLHERDIFLAPRNHRSRMMMELAREMVDTLTGKSGIEFDVKPGASQFPWEVQFSQEMVSIVGQATLYELVVQENSSFSLEDAWRKVAFLLGWLLDMAFAELQKTGLEEHLGRLMDAVVEADETRKSVWTRLTGKSEMEVVGYESVFTSRFPQRRKRQERT